MLWIVILGIVAAALLFVFVFGSVDREMDL